MSVFALGSCFSRFSRGQKQVSSGVTLDCTMQKHMHCSALSGMEGISSKNICTVTVLEVVAVYCRKRSRISMGFLSSAHPQNMFLITCCLKAPGNFAAWIQGLYAVLLFPLVVGRAPYSCRGKHSLSSFYSNGQYANEVVKNGWNTKAVWMHLHKL